MLLSAQLLDDLDFSWYSQGDPRWKYDNLGYSRWNTIGKSGCVLTCLSMLFNSEASNQQVTPEQLNNWLIENKGYSYSDMRWEIVAKYDGDGKGIEFVARTDRRNDWKFLSNQLELGRKVLVKVRGRQHWVVITKRNGPYNSANSYEVYDPGTPIFQKKTLAKWGGFRAARSFSGNWVNRDQIKMNDDVALLATDSLDTFLYNHFEVENPAELYVNIENGLNVALAGYFSLGLYTSENKFIDIIGFPMYLTINPKNNKEVLFGIEGVDDMLKTNYQIKLLYAKSLDDKGKPQNALVLNPSGLETFSFKMEEMEKSSGN